MRSTGKLLYLRLYIIYLTQIVTLRHKRFCKKKHSFFLPLLLISGDFFMPALVVIASFWNLTSAISFCFAVIRAEVTGARHAKGQGSYTLLKIKRHQKRSSKGDSRNSRKAKKASDPDRVLVQNNGCLNNLRWKEKSDQNYLIILQKRSLKKKTKYIVKAIVPWNRRYRRMMKKNHCKRR